MNRLTILQRLVNFTQAKTYLEIGVFQGEIISNLSCSNKIGVDPDFKLTRSASIKKFLPKKKFKTFPCTSDHFFNHYADNALKNGIDVAFVDGLHTYEQSLKDVENCLKYLNPHGFIVMHDCNPLSEAIAYPVTSSFNDVLKLAHNGEIPGWNGAWTGDVWKTIVHLRATKKDLNIFTLDLDWGLGIISKGNPESTLKIPIDQIEKKDYYYLESNRRELLNLKKPKYLEKLFKK